MPLCGLVVERRATLLDPTFVLVGELDLASIGATGTLLTDETAAVGGDVGLDLSRLAFIGFAGVDLLIALSHRLAADRRRLRVHATNPIVDRVLGIAGVQLTQTGDGELSVLTGPPSLDPDGRGRPSGTPTGGNGALMAAHRSAR